MATCYSYVLFIHNFLPELAEVYFLENIPEWESINKFNIKTITERFYFIHLEYDTVTNDWMNFIVYEDMLAQSVITQIPELIKKINFDFIAVEGPNGSNLEYAGRMKSFSASSKLIDTSYRTETTTNIDEGSLSGALVSVRVGIVVLEYMNRIIE